MMDGHWFWGMHWLWWAFWMILVFVVSGLWMRRGPDDQPARGETALEILRRRYAEGEISTDEYEERKARLEADR